MAAEISPRAGYIFLPLWYEMSRAQKRYEKSNMKLFKSKAEKELDSIIDEMKVNLANNYKSTAHAARVKLGRRCEELFAEGRINEETFRKYNAIYEEYTIMLKDYHH